MVAMKRLIFNHRKDVCLTFRATKSTRCSAFMKSPLNFFVTIMETKLQVSEDFIAKHEQN